MDFMAKNNNTIAFAAVPILVNDDVKKEFLRKMSWAQSLASATSRLPYAEHAF